MSYKVLSMFYDLQLSAKAIKDLKAMTSPYHPLKLDANEAIKWINNGYLSLPNKYTTNKALIHMFEHNIEECCYSKYDVHIARIIELTTPIFRVKHNQYGIEIEDGEKYQLHPRFLESIDEKFVELQNNIERLESRILELE